MVVCRRNFVTDKVYGPDGATAASMRHSEPCSCRPQTNRQDEKNFIDQRKARTYVIDERRHAL